MKSRRITLAITLIVFLICLIVQSKILGAQDYDTGVRNARRGETGMRGNSIGSRMTVKEVRLLLDAHNAARKEVGVPALNWSESLARYAQEWADHLASTIYRIEHRPNSGKWKQEHGENLFMGTAGHYGVGDAVASWYTEKSAYHGGAIEMSRFYAYGHYTQLVWKNTRNFGCAKAESNGNIIIVCNYDPPGNMVGYMPY